MSTSFRARLRSGERLIAPLVTLNSPAVVELLAEVGFDWLFIDAEHSPLDTAQMQALMQARRRHALRRPAVGQRRTARQAGARHRRRRHHRAAGQLRRARATDRPGREVRPRRSARARHRQGASLRPAGARVHAERQRRHRRHRPGGASRRVAHIREIVRVDGVDGVLDRTLRSVGQPRTSRSRRSSRGAGCDRARCRDACREANIPIGIFGLTADAVKPYIEQGFTMIVAGVDTVLLATCVFGAPDGGSSHPATPPVETR